MSTGLQESMSNEISHAGVIESIAEGCVKVRILQTSACASCKVAAHCNASESKVKVVDVCGAPNVSSLSVGQSVVVSTSRDVANRALLLGFGLPFLLLVAVLMVVLWITGNEGIAALSAIGSLVPYYMVLWLLRDRISRQVRFEIKD